MFVWLSGNPSLIKTKLWNKMEKMYFVNESVFRWGIQINVTLWVCLFLPLHVRSYKIVCQHSNVCLSSSLTSIIIQWYVWNASQMFVKLQLCFFLPHPKSPPLNMFNKQRWQWRQKKLLTSFCCTPYKGCGGGGIDSTPWSLLCTVHYTKAILRVRNPL